MADVANDVVERHAVGGECDRVGDPVRREHRRARARRDDARQREPATELQHARARLRRIGRERARERLAARPQACPIGDRTAGAALLVAQRLPVRRQHADDIAAGEGGPAHRYVKQGRGQSVGRLAAQGGELLGQRGPQGDQRVGHDSMVAGREPLEAVPATEARDD
jgi:hypothetical protein